MKTTAKDFAKILSILDKTKEEQNSKYPVRPGKNICSFFLKTKTCKYGIIYYCNISFIIFSHSI